MKALRLFYLLFAIALLPLPAWAVSLAPASTAHCATVTVMSHVDCSHTTNASSIPFSSHYHGACCQAQVATLPVKALAYAPLRTPQDSQHVADFTSYIQNPRARPPQR